MYVYRWDASEGVTVEVPSGLRRRSDSEAICLCGQENIKVRKIANTKTAGCELIIKDSEKTTMAKAHVRDRER